MQFGTHLALKCFEGLHFWGSLVGQDGQDTYSQVQDMALYVNGECSI